MDGWVDGWGGGWMDGSKSRVKDCLQQSKNVCMKWSMLAELVLILDIEVT